MSGSVRHRHATGGKGTGGGKGLGKSLRRHRKIMKDTVHGISKGDIRRLARRGGVKRISHTIYEDSRGAMVDFLKAIMKDVIVYLEYSRRRTVTVTDVIFALKRVGKPIYGFDPEFPIKHR